MFKQGNNVLKTLKFKYQKTNKKRFRNTKIQTKASLDFSMIEENIFSIH